MFAPDKGNSERFDYIKDVSRIFWLGLADRILNPGCINDFMVIIEGKQGIGKSTALQEIGGKYYIVSGLGGKEEELIRYVIGHGTILVEVAELDPLEKTGTNKIKRFITNREDGLRQLYRPHRVIPRSFIVTGTTNDASYLSDDTGNRRYLPIEVDKVNLEAIKRDRDQLFGEAAHRILNREVWHNISDYASTMAEERRELHPWTEFIREYLLYKLNNKPNEKYVTIKEIFETKIQGTDDNQSAVPKRRENLKEEDPKAIGKILRNEFDLYRKQNRINGLVKWCFIFPDNIKEILTDMKK